MWLFSVNLKRHLTAFAAIVLLGGMVQAEPAPPEKLDELRDASEVDAPRVARALTLYRKTLVLGALLLALVAAL